MTVARVADNQWHAIEDDLVVGRGFASRRLDGRTFLSIDTWRTAVFDRLAAAMLVDQPGPRYTVVDEAERDLTASWERAGFVVWRREIEYVVPTDLPQTEPPRGVSITGDAEVEQLRELDRAIRAEVEATVGWHTMPAEVLSQRSPVDPANYTVAVRDGRYVGLVRVATRTRRPRIGLIAVLAAEQRRGIGRALLGRVLGDLRQAGTVEVTAEVDESNTAGTALFSGARRTGRSLELRA
ncbi:GNAT family N-acetyltransferase [Kribbella sp. NPDC026611]|uniref:GNAT family N-acetyltransferase n=1 Tax=Kribbella sp. NPDC026611 TaxID=3154911 RepID=UPI0033F76D4A